MKMKIINFLMYFFGGVSTLLSKRRIGRYFMYEVGKSLMKLNKEVVYNGCHLKFTVPNWVCDGRAGTFSTKEPETLEWIDSIPDEAILWDIGANIGLYSCYAAKKKKLKVFAFEPSVFNLELLARNIYINNLCDNVVIVPIPLTDTIKISALNMTTTNWGGALSTFGENYGDDGKPIRKVFEFNSIGISMKDAVEFLGVRMPDYVKMDVDGIESLIIKGGMDIMNKVQGILVEVNEDSKEQAENVEKYLSDSGLILKEKRHAEQFENHERLSNTYNQIWCRR